MKVVYEIEKEEYRGEEFEFTYISFRDDAEGESYTTTESDGIWLSQLTNQYRERHSIPYTDEIIALRERYGLSASKMSVILGFGTNQYRLYEDGEVPSESNGKMIRSAMNPLVFMDLVKSSRHQLTEKDYAKISARVKDVIAQSEQWHDEALLSEKLFLSSRGLGNGFAPQSAARLKNLLLYVLKQLGETYQTKMNKVLFYIDFLSYRERGIAISGLAYEALAFGPAPQRWDRVYSYFDEVDVHLRLVQGQECISLSADTDADISGFSEREIQIINTVCQKLKDMNSKEVSKLSHEETAWITHQKEHEHIPFKDAFSLKAM
jgi:hypothetical protein